MAIFKKSIEVLLLVAVYTVLACSPAYCQAAKVAVFPVKNNGQAQYASLAEGLATMFAGDLAKSKGIEVIDPAATLKALDRARFAGGAPSVDDALKAAASLSADYALMGEFVVFGGRFRIDIRVYDVATGQVRSSEKAQAKEDAFFDMVDDLSGKVIVMLAGSLPTVGGTLMAVSDPPGGTLLIDGAKSGRTPATVRELSLGPHEVEIDLDGYRPFTQTVVVAEGETTKLDAKLIRLYGGIRVWWQDYPDSDVSISGAIVGMSNFQYNPQNKYCKNLPAGTYTVTARMPYRDESSWDVARTWRTYSADIEVRPGEVQDVFLNNNLHSPGIQVSACGGCVANWDFNTAIVWFETR